MADRPAEITRMVIRGTEVSGWSGLEISRSLEQVCTGFRFTATHAWPERVLDGHADSPIIGGDPVEVYLGDDRVSTGWVDVVERAFEPGDHALAIEGRDKTADLVDCGAECIGGLSGQTLPQIAAHLAKPVGVEVRYKGANPAPVIADFAVHQGEAIHEALERHARQAGLLLTSDTMGRLVIGRPGKERHNSPLIEGRNMLAGRMRYSHLERYSHYKAAGQAEAGEYGDPVQAASGFGTAIDPHIKRYRPLVLRAERAGDSDQYTDRARWERNLRAGRGDQAVIMVQGWRDDEGQLWQPNRLVYVESAWLSIKRDMLISGVTYTLDDRGTLTQLVLMPPGAFDPTLDPLPSGQW